MGGALAILIVIALIIKLGGGAAAKLAEQMLERQNVVSGTLAYEKINAGFAGDVEIRNLVWKAPNGGTKMEIPLMTVSVNFFDALRQGGGVASVANIVLNKPKFYGVYEEGQGLDLLNLLKVAGQETIEVGKKADIPVHPTDFRGLIEVKDGTVDLTSNGKIVNLDKLNSQMAFKQYPLIRTSTTASKGSCDLVLSMDYENGTAKVQGEAKNAEVADVMAMYPDLKNIKVVSGTIPTVKIDASKDKDGWHIRLEGKPRNMAGEFFGMKFSGGEGSFSADRDVAMLQSVRADVNGMPVMLRGTIRSGRGTPFPPGFDLEFSADHFKTQTLSKGLYLDDGAVTLSGRLTGNAVEPELKGIFSSDYLLASPLRLTGVRGSFAWEAGKFTLKDAEAMGAGTKISISGSLMIPGGEYDLTLTGQNLEAGSLTDNRVTGLFWMKAQVSGKDQADSAAGNGQFIMQKGRYYSTEGNLRSEEIRLLEGNILIRDGMLGSRDAEIKLGRNKYSVSVTAGNKESAEVKVGKKISSSLF